MYLRVSVKSIFPVLLKSVRQWSAQGNFMLYPLPNSSFSLDIFCSLTKVIQKLGLNILKFLVSNVAAQNQGALSSSCPITRWILGAALVRLFLWSVTWKPAIPAGTECPADSRLFSCKYLSGQCYWNIGKGFISCLPLLLLFLTGFSASLTIFEPTVLQKPASVVLHLLKEQIWLREWAISKRCFGLGHAGEVGSCRWLKEQGVGVTGSQLRIWGHASRSCGWRSRAPSQTPLCTPRCCRFPPSSPCFWVRGWGFSAWTSTLAMPCILSLNWTLRLAGSRPESGSRIS